MRQLDFLPPPVTQSERNRSPRADGSLWIDNDSVNKTQRIFAMPNTNEMN